MDVPYTKEDLFGYTVDIPSVAYAKEYLEERGYPLQGKELVIIIPDRNEDPEALRSTVIQLATSAALIGLFLQVDREHFRIKRIIVGDQSDPKIARTNRGLLYTVRDVLRNMLGKIDIPEIYHLPFNEEISEIAYEYVRDYLKISRKEKGTPLLGKGVNMALSSLVSSELTEGGIMDENTVLVYMDAENKEINYRDPFLLGSPLIYEGSPVLFTKAAFRRYHMEEETRKIGGRVNASLGVPLITMLVYKGLLAITRPIIYPLSGEIGIERSLFWSMKIAKRYGVETTTLLQLFGKDEDDAAKLPEGRFLQIDLGINMDQPLAEGKPPREVLRGVRNMSEDIIASTFQIMGTQIREAWGSSEGFMKMFRELQIHSMERWMQSHDSRLITGGISPEDLRRTVYGVVREHVDNLFSEESFIRRMWREIRQALHPSDEGFIPPMNDIKDNMGNKFDELREQFIRKSKRIYPEG